MTKDIWSPPFQITRSAIEDAPLLAPFAAPVDLLCMTFVPVFETVFGVFLTEEFREAASAYNANRSFRGEDYAGIGRSNGSSGSGSSAPAAEGPRSSTRGPCGCQLAGCRSAGQNGWALSPCDFPAADRRSCGCDQPAKHRKR